MSHGKQIAQNAAWLFVATTLQKALAFISFTAIANIVGVETTGRYYFAVSVTSLFVALTDLGLTPVVIREVASDPERGKAAFRTAFRIKAILIPVAIVASLMYAVWVQVDLPLFLAIATACFVMSADALSLLLYGVIRGHRVLRFESIGMFFGQLVTALVGIGMAYFGAGVIGLVFALFCGSLLNVIWSYYQLRKHGWDKSEQQAWPWKKLAQMAIPFALAGVFTKIYSYTDSLMLREFFGETAVGYYAVAYKVTYAFQFLPLAFVAALYPGMSAAFAAKDNKALRSIVDGSLRLMMLTAVPLSACLSALSDRVIGVFYRGFSAGSVVPLMILPWVLIPIFLDFPIGSLLNSTHRAAQKTKAMGLTMIVNVLANIILTPLFGPTGAALAGLASFWCLCLFGLWFVRKDALDWPAFFQLFVRGMLSALATWLLVRFLTPIMPWPFAFLFAGAIAMISLLVFGVLRIADIRHVLGWLQRRTPQPVEEVVE